MLTGQVEFDVMYADLSSGYSAWRDQSLRLNLQLPSGDHLSAEISRQNHFDDQGTFYGAAYTHIFDDDWYGSLHLGGSSGGFFLPSFRIDAFLNHKWLASWRLVTTLRLGQYNTKDDHRDRTVLLGASYYFLPPFIVEAGLRLNSSDPGAVTSSRQFGVLTYGRQGDYYPTLRHESGDEAYQLIGPSALISEFSSHETSIGWRQWLKLDLGWVLQLNHYNNPSYNRRGVQAGIFYEF